MTVAVPRFSSMLCSKGAPGYAEFVKFLGIIIIQTGLQYFMELPKVPPPV